MVLDNQDPLNAVCVLVVLNTLPDDDKVALHLNEYFHAPWCSKSAWLAIRSNTVMESVAARDGIAAHAASLKLLD